MKDFFSLVVVSVAAVIIISVGGFLITSSTQIGRQQRIFDCWNATYSEKETCKVLQLEQKSFWADSSKPQSLPNVLQITLQQPNSTIFSLLAPFTRADWLASNKTIDCYFPKSIDCSAGANFENVWLGNPFTPNKASDGNDRSTLIGMGCFLIVVGLALCGIGTLWWRKHQ